MDSTNRPPEYKQISDSRLNDLRAIPTRLSDRGFRAFSPYLIAFALTAFISWRAIHRSSSTASALLVLASFVVVAAILVRQGRIAREARLLTSRLSQQVDRDPLTGLPNRRRVQEWIERELLQARASGHALGLALIDIDNFKSVNDTYGHSAGDHALKAIAGVLSRACRGSDIAVRYAGDEFLLVLPGLELQDAHLVGQRLLKEVGRSRKPGSSAIGVEISISIGIAVSRECSKSAKQLISIADAAMYDAKDAGKNQMVIVDADMKVLDITSHFRTDEIDNDQDIELLSTVG